MGGWVGEDGVKVEGQALLYEGKSEGWITELLLTDIDNLSEEEDEKGKKKEGTK